jgi:tetratricopeptide (TPR) repeat protein
VFDLPPGYRDPRPIGKGGFAVVWRAWSEQFGRDVALKLPIAAEEDRDLQRELALELHAAARLRHHNIIQVLDAGTTPSGLPFLAMELAEHGSLIGLVASPPAWPQLRELLEGVLRGLAHAHARGVVHRDIKPGNILLTRDGDGPLVPRIADFGLAKVLQEYGWYSSTRMGAGTLLYMPPEQFDSDLGAVHPAADLYAFGVLAWMLVCGSAPFEVDGGLGPLLSAKLQMRLTAWSPRAVGVPDGLERLLNRLLARHPESRPELASDVLDGLARLADGRGSPPPAPSWSGYEDSLLVDLEDSAFRPAGPQAVTLSVDPPAPPAPPEFPSTAGVAGVREPRFVGRERAREELWTATRAALRSPRGVVLRGSPGVGRSRLMGWLSASLEERGIARTLHVRADRPDGVSAAMVRAVRRLLGLGHVRGTPLRVRLDRWLGPRSEGSAGERGIADWLMNRTSPPGAAVLDRVLRAEAARGLVVVWLQDLGAGEALARQAEALLQQANAAPFPLLLVYEPAAGGPVPQGWRSLEVLPLSDAEVATLAVDLLPDGVSADPIVVMARGIPGVAVQAARLAATARSPSDPTGSGAATLATAPALAAARLESLAASDPRSDDLRTLLLLLALLPRPAAPSVLAGAWERLAEGSAPSGLLDGARRGGVVTEDAWGLEFSDPTFAEAAVGWAEHLDLVRARLACADALLESEDVPASLSVAASRLLLDADEPARALDVAREAAASLRHTDVAASRAAWSQAREACVRLALDDADPMTVAVILGQARAARAEGDVPATAELLARLRDQTLSPSQQLEWVSLQCSIAMIRGEYDVVLTLTSDDDLETDLLVVRAEALRRAGRLEESAVALEAALAAAEGVGDAHTVVACRWRLARLRRHLGRPEAALAGLRQALEEASALDDPDVEAQVLRELGHLELAAGRMAEAEEALRRSLDKSASAGARSETAVTRLSLGELARKRGDLAAARRDYSAGLAVANAFGVTYLAVTALLNLAIAELAMDKLPMAERRMRALDRMDVTETLRPWIELVRAAVLARGRRWDAVDEALASLEGEAERLRGQEDFALLLEQIGDGAAAVARPDVAGAAYAIAMEIAELDGHQDARSSLRRRLSALAML